MIKSHTNLPNDAIVRDPEGFSGTNYDLIVIGAGIYGIMLTLEASRRNLSCLLLERDDFGQHTSFNHLRILHGGLRYLQKLDLRRFRDSVKERSWFIRHFPELAGPLKFILPLYGKGLYRPVIFRLAFALDAILAIDRNFALTSEQRFPAGRILKPEETSLYFSEMDRNGLKGGALWYDGFVPDSPRLLIEVLRWSCLYGSKALNYFSVDGLLKKNGIVSGVKGRDTLHNIEYEFRAKKVINAAGPWNRLVGRMGDRDRQQLFPNRVLVWNLLFDRPPISDCALAVTGHGYRAHTYFILPWKGRLMIGTGHVSLLANEDRCPSKSEISFMIDEINQAVPAVNLQSQEILRIYYGIMPGDSDAQLSTRPVFIDHGKSGGLRNFYSVSGVKFTTARKVADKSLTKLFPKVRPRHYDQNFRPSLRKSKRNLELTDFNLNELSQLKEEESVTNMEDLILRRCHFIEDHIAKNDEKLKAVKDLFLGSVNYFV